MMIVGSGLGMRGVLVVKARARVVAWSCVLVERKLWSSLKESALLHLLGGRSKSYEV